MKDNAKRHIQVRKYPEGTSHHTSKKFTLIETIWRKPWLEQIGNFNPMFCTYNGERTLVHSDYGDISDPFRREESFLGSLFIEAKQWPDCYLYVRECRSGEEWVAVIKGHQHIDLRHNIERWVRRQFNGELAIDGKIQPRLEGDYYAKIITDNRPPGSVVVWQSGGFWLKTTY